MLKSKHSITIAIIFMCTAAFAQTKISVRHFEKIIVSPHIQVTFVEGNEENVVIEKCSAPIDKIHIEVNGKTLRVYLEGAKEITKNEDDGYTGRRAIYHGTVVAATINYKALQALSIRGDETQVCQSLLAGKKFRLKMYGNPHVFLNEVNLGKLKASVYGDGELNIKTGSIGHQKYTSYGESRINTVAIDNHTTKITAFGKASFRLHVSDAIRIVSFGEASVAYEGDPTINKWFHFGEMQISKID